MKIKIPVDHHIHRKLTEAGIDHDTRVSHVTVDADSYAHFLKRIATDYPHLSSEEQHALAISTCLTHPDHKAKQNPPRIPIEKVKTWPWQNWLIVVIALVLALGFATMARCQTSQIDVITFKNAANTTVKSYAAPFTIKEGTGVTFSASGSVLTLNTSGGSGGYATIQSAGAAITQRAIANFFGAIFCADNAGATRSDCTLAANAAVANQFLTGVDASGNFIRAQPSYSNISGTIPAITSLATTSPITGGPITATGTIACATCVTSSTPGVGIAHFAGGTQAVTSSAIDVSGTDITGVLKASAHPALTGDVTTVAGNLATTLATVATPGTSPKVTFNAKGLVTSGTTLASGDIPNNAANTSGNAGTATAFDHTPTLCTAGNYPLGILASGAATGCTAASGSGTVTHTAGALTLNQLVFGNGAADIAVGDLTGDVTTSGGKATTLATVASPGTGLKTTVNAKGLVTAVTTAASTDLSDTGNLARITTSNTYSASTTQDMDTARAKYWGGAPVFDAFEYAGADMCAKIAAVFADAAFVNGGIIDARGFTGDQNCATQFGSLAAMSYKLILGRVKIHTTVKWNIAAGAWTNVVAVPSAPGLATSTTTGSLAATTQFGVKVTLVNGVGETTGSAEATITTGAGATNIITVTSPTAAFNATCYNVYAHTPIGSGWLLSNTFGCIPIGQNYVIKTIPVGVAVPASNTAVYDTAVEIEGQGESTIISLENTAAFIQPQNNNVYLHNFAVTNAMTSNTGNGLIYVGSARNFVLDRLYISGGGAGIYVDQSFDGRIQNIRWGKPTFAVASAVAIAGSGPSSRILIQNIDVEPSVYPTTAFVSSGVSVSQGSNITIDRVRCSNLDMSQSTNGGCIEIGNGANTVAGGVSFINVSNIMCDSLIWADCIAVTGFSSNVNIDNFVSRNTNAVAGVNGLTTFQQGDCLDIFMSSKINITNGICQNLNSLSHTLPSIEIFDTTEVSMSNVQSLDSAAGVKLFGAPSTHFTNVSTNRHFNTGYLILDYSALVTCNGTTAVVFVSGGGGSFGPWLPGTPITINGAPHQIASVTDGTHLTTAANCTTGASVAMVLATTDVSIVNPKADDNGMNAVGTGARTGTSEGISIQGGSQVTIIGGSANDNKATASKTQQFGLRVTGTARVRVIGFDGSGNVGAVTAPCTGIEYGANVAGNHAICDDPKGSAILIDDNATNMWTASALQTIGPNNESGQADTVADSAGINTTETIIVKTPALNANRLIAGTHIRFTLIGTCNASVANASTFTIRMGTAGTTADTAIATPVTGVSGTGGAAIPFKAEIDFTVRTVGASATGFITLQVDSNGLTGILAAQTPAIILPSMSTFNTTTAGNIISVSYKSAATTTTSTFKQATVEFVYQ